MSNTILPGVEDWGKVAKEIAFLSTALKKRRNGEVEPAPRDDALWLFQHISTLVTTGEIGEKGSDTTAARVNAVTGRLDFDRIAIVIFTRQGKGKWYRIQPSEKSECKKILEDWESMRDDVSFETHLQDVVDILSYIISNECTSSDRGLFNLFIHRRALSKLAARVEKAIRLWGEAPFHIVAKYYNGSQRRPLVSAVFNLNCPSRVHAELEAHGLKRTRDLGQYIATSENIGAWVELIDRTYTDIEEIVLVVQENGTKKSRCNPLTVDEALLLLPLLALFYTLINSDELMSAVFRPTALEVILITRFCDATLAPSSLDNNAGGLLQDEEQEDDASDEIETSEVLGGRSQVLRYSQTITAWYTAVCAVVNSSSRFPPATMMLDVYRVHTLPLRHNVSQQDVLFFKTNYLEHLQKCGVPEHRLKRTNIFVDDMTRGSGFIEQVSSALVHAEAAAMGLMCISLFDSPPFGEITKDWVESALPTSGKVSIAASKKCCWCCALLARLLTQENTHAVEFVLPGTHAIIFSWSPPRGVPLVILQKMRDALAIAFTHEAKSYEALPSSTGKAAAVIVDNCLYPLPS